MKRRRLLMDKREVVAQAAEVFRRGPVETTFQEEKKHEKQGFSRWQGCCLAERCMATAALTNASPDLAETLWLKIVRDYRQACVLHRQARREESQRMLEGVLPESILAWAECDPTDGATQTQRLEAMFQQERQRIEDAWLAQEFAQQRWQAELLPALSAHIGEEVRKAVRTLPAARPVAVVPAPMHQVAPRIIAQPEPRSARPTRTAASDIASIIDLLLEQECSTARQHLAV